MLKHFKVTDSISQVSEWTETDSLGRVFHCILYSDGSVLKQLV